MLKRVLPYLFSVVLAAVTIAAAYLLLKPHYKTTGLTIGLVNMQRVRTQATPFQQLHKQDVEARAKAQELLETLEKSVRKEYDELQDLQQKKHVKAEELAKRKLALDKRVAELDQHFHQERDAIRQRFERIALVIEGELERIIRDFRNQHKIDLFLNTTTNDQQIAIVADDSLNHTDAIIELLNKSASSIKELKK